MERQLPALIWVLLVPTVAILVVWTQAQVRQDLLSAAGTRMEGSAREVASLFERGVSARLRYVERAASSEAFRAYLREPSAENEDAARSALSALLSTRTGVTELWTSAGQLALQERFVAEEDTSPDRSPELVRAPRAPPAATGHQPLRMEGGGLVHEVVVEVRDVVAEGGPDPVGEAAEAPGPVLGHLVLRRPISPSAGTEMLARLVGVDARFVMGNKSGDLWTDLSQAVPPPPLDPLDKDQRHYKTPAGAQRIGAGIELANSPWILWVESDASAVTARTRRLLVRMLFLGGLLLVAGGFGAWWISRRITVPLRRATEAAEAMAAGDYQQRLDVHGHDEVGRLIEAFNVMAQKVEEARADLESRVEARTTDLCEALDRLQDAQGELVRNEKLALLGQLAGSVGHELRNPLGVMNNAVYYLEMVMEDAPSEVREYLGILRRQVSLAEKIVSDLLDFTRQGPPQRREISLPQVIDEQIARMGGLSVAIQREFEPDLPSTFADRVQMGQVIFNLLTNAVQAVEGRSTPCITIRARRADGVLHVEVDDTGKGIAPELHEKIFEPLFTTRARGIGLGLSVSRRLARNNGGDLYLASSTPDSGACFVLVVPIQVAVAQS